MNANSHRPLPDRRRRHWLLAGASCAVAAGTGAWLLRRAPATPALPRPGRLDSAPDDRELRWDDLVPADWDPLKALRQADGSRLDDTDPKAMALLADLRTIWNDAPTVAELDGASVRLPGYVVPLDVVDGSLREFLLVPYFGACIHTPPPPANQIVHVTLSKPVKGFSAMDTVWVSGRMSAVRDDSPMGASGYRLLASTVAPYVVSRP